MRRLRVGWLAPEDCTLPPGAHPGSVTTTIWEVVTRLSDRCEFVLATREHPVLGELPMELDGVRYLRDPAVADVRRGEVLKQLNRVERKLGLPDPPYAGRPSYFRGYARAHAEGLRRAEVDLVQLYNTSQWVPILRAALPRTPIVLQMHSEWLAEIPRREGLERLRLVDRVLGVSQQIADQIRDRYPERAEIVDVLPNGVDLDGFRPADEVRATRAGDVEALRRRLGLGDGPVVLFLGRISAEKGIHTLLEALPAVRERLPGVQVLIAGERAGLRSPLPTRERRELIGHPEWRARYIDHLLRLAEPLGDAVRFCEPLAYADVPLAFALADVYVQPSVLEAYGLPVVEAMASELPVIVSDGGALPELVDDGTTGYVVPAGDARALADALVMVLSDRELAARLGRAGRERAARTMSWDTVAERLLALYDDLVAAGARPAPDALPVA